MKNILLATTALVMTAGVASAEITFSGTATAGWAKNGGAAKGAADDGKTETYSEINLTAAASVTTDSGITLSTAASLDAGAGYDLADDDGFDGAKTTGLSVDNVKISGAFGTLMLIQAAINSKCLPCEITGTCAPNSKPNAASNTDDITYEEVK